MPKPKKIADLSKEPMVPPQLLGSVLNCSRWQVLSTAEKIGIRPVQLRNGRYTLSFEQAEKISHAILEAAA